MLRQEYDHVLWLGGSPCAGKSSIAAMLAPCYHVGLYSADRELGRHCSKLTHAQYPMLYKWTHSPWHDLWMQPQSVLLQEAIAAYKEHFQLIVEDLRSLPHDRPLLVEGTCLLPDWVAELEPKPGRALWLAPTEEFQRRHYAQRGGWLEDILASCHEPDVAFGNWMNRDAAFARWVVQRCQELGLPHRIVDGTQSIGQNTMLVAEHLDLSPD